MARMHIIHEDFFILPYGWITYMKIYSCFFKYLVVVVGCLYVKKEEKKYGGNISIIK